MNFENEMLAVTKAGQQIQWLIRLVLISLIICLFLEVHLGNVNIPGN